LKTIIRVAIFVCLVADGNASENVAAKQTVEGINDCPATITESTRLLVVSTNGMKSPRANIQLFQRESKIDNWRSAGPSWPGMVGRNGLGWAWDQAHYSKPGEPIKKEGDGKAPAGVFLVGAPFGFKTKSLDNYITLKKETTACVDDVRSKHYNKIVDSKAISSNMSHEKMWKINLYRHGLLVNHKTNRKKRGGSCIFVHVWRHKNKSTAGCVAFDAKNVVKIQSEMNAQISSIAILPSSSLKALGACNLPGLQ